MLALMGCTFFWIGFLSLSLALFLALGALLEQARAAWQRWRTPAPPCPDKPPVPPAAPPEVPHD